MVTQERLKQLLAFDPEAGVFFWRDNYHKRRIGLPAGTVTRSGHIRISVDGTAYLAHRLAWLYVHGEMPKLIDHINQNPADNRLRNLRPASRRENRLNSKIGSNNKSGHTGVCWHAVTRKWRAFISVGGRPKHLGVFDTVESAVAARKAALAADGGAHRRYGLAKN